MQREHKLWCLACLFQHVTCGLLLLFTLHEALQVWGTGHDGGTALSCRHRPSSAWPSPHSSSPPPPSHPATPACARAQSCDVQHLGGPVLISGVLTESAVRLLSYQVPSLPCSVVQPKCVTANRGKQCFDDM